MVNKKKHKRFWNYKRSFAEDRSFLDWCGARKEPSVNEGMAHVEAFLEDLVDEVGLNEGLTIENLQNTWAEMVGYNIANNSEPIEIYNGALKIRVSQPVIKFELQQMHSLLLKRVQEKLPKAKIKRLDIFI